MPADTSLTLTSAESTANLSVRVIDDEMIENNKEFMMTLSTNETRVTLNPDTAILNIMRATVGKWCHISVQQFSHNCKF